MIERVSPCVDGGRFMVKRVVGERVVVEADIFADGHDLIRAMVRHRRVGESEWRESEMKPLVNDRWRGMFHVEHQGVCEYEIEGWIDRFGSWRRDLGKKAQAGQVEWVDLEYGAQLLEGLAARAHGEAKSRLVRTAGELRDESSSMRERVASAMDEEVLADAHRHDARAHSVRTEEPVRIRVDRERARFSTWYELFPRSMAEEPGRHGTFADVEAKLDHVAALGFDVVYLPPIHPIGVSFRKGKNNTLTPGPDDVGSPWAIGGPVDGKGTAGGHTAIHPALGTEAEFVRLVESARAREMEIALDIAFQCSADHPWVKEHPAWFRRRADGSIQYAENPPKKYQDIYPLDFESEDWENLWGALRDVMLYWVDRGVKIFRVDNPHTKAFGFWEWAIAEIKGRHPEVIFLSEAFTRPKLMYRLAKLGFTQSYTYFAWRNEPWELQQYFEELTQTEVIDFFRPNAWPNTPDILTEYLQTGGRAALLVRLVLAGTLCASYGIYGPPYEAGDVRAREPGSEEYLDSEKYQLRQWRFDRERLLSAFIGRVNRIRREHAALRQDRTLRFHKTDNPKVVCYSKTDPARAGPGGASGGAVLVAVNTDPHHFHWANTDLDLKALGLEEGEAFEVVDLLTNARFRWEGGRNAVGLDPAGVPAHVFEVRAAGHTEADREEFA